MKYNNEYIYRTTFKKKEYIYRTQFTVIEMDIQLFQKEIIISTKKWNISIYGSVLQEYIYIYIQDKLLIVLNPSFAKSYATHLKINLL